MDLFESFDEIVNDEFIEKFKSYINDTHGDINTCVHGIFYTLLAGMIRKTNSDMSAGMLFNQIQENAKRVDLPNNLASIFSQDSVLKKIEANGNKIISQIFPAYKSPLLSMISTYAGTSKATTSLASGIVSNVLISLFKKDAESGKWDKDQMVGVIRQHHEPLLNIIPENLLEKMIPSLGLQDLMVIRPHTPKKDKNDGLIPNKNKETAQEEVKKTDYPTSFEDSGSSTNWWIIGALIALLALAGGAYYYYTENGSLPFFNKKEVPVESLEPVENTTAEDSLTLSTAAQPAVNQPSNSEFSTFKSYVLNKSEVAGKEFEFKSIKFIADSVTVAPESVTLIDSIAALMKENIRLQLKITAFSGSGDTPFNNKRAFAVKRILTSRGIEAIKIDAVSGGIGEDFAKIKVISK